MDVALGAGATVAIVEGADAAAAAKPDAEKAALDETKRKRLRAAKLYVAAEKAGKKMGKGPAAALRAPAAPDSARCPLLSGQPSTRCR